MKFSKDQILLHINALIDQQQQDLDELTSNKPKKMRLRFDRAKDQISHLRALRHSLITNTLESRDLLQIVKDMEDIGWQHCDFL